MARERVLGNQGLRASVLCAAIGATALAAQPAQAHHKPCNWGVDVTVSTVEPSVSYGPPLAMWGCHEPIVWATVIGPDGTETFVPVYGARAGSATESQSAGAIEEKPAESQPSRSTAKKAKSKCKRRAKRSARKSSKRCAARAKRAKSRRR